jgi:hypothetical protein
LALKKNTFLYTKIECHFSGAAEFCTYKTTDNNYSYAAAAAYLNHAVNFSNALIVEQ